MVDVVERGLHRCAHMITTLGLSPNCSGFRCRDAPAAIASITRSRKSIEHGLGTVSPGKRINAADSRILKSLGIPPFLRFYGAETALNLVLTIVLIGRVLTACSAAVLTAALPH